MQFETWLELHKRLWTTNELTAGYAIPLYNLHHHFREITLYKRRTSSWIRSASSWVRVASRWLATRGDRRVSRMSVAMDNWIESGSGHREEVKLSRLVQFIAPLTTFFATHTGWSWWFETRFCIPVCHDISAQFSLLPKQNRALRGTTKSKSTEQGWGVS